MRKLHSLHENGFFPEIEISLIRYYLKFTSILLDSLINYHLIVLAKEQKDGELTKATTLGEQEIRRFHQQRLSEMKVS